MNILKKLPSTNVLTTTKCEICNNTFATALITYPDFPITEFYLDSFYQADELNVPLHLDFCLNCQHAQLRNIISAEFLYSDIYQTKTKNSSSEIMAVQYIQHFLNFIRPHLIDKNITSIIDIGCNDTYLLEQFIDYDTQLICIDPIWKTKSYEGSNKIKVIGDFIENIEISQLDIPLDIVCCSHTLEHIQNPLMFINNLEKHSDENTLFFFQFPSLDLLVQDARFDQVFHQHYHYFSLFSFNQLIKSCGGEIIDYKFNPYHWGTLMVAFRLKKKTSTTSISKALDQPIIDADIIMNQYQFFKKHMALSQEKIRSIPQNELIGYGAALMLPALNYHLGNALDNLLCILDENESKHNKYYSNMAPPIKSPLKEPEWLQQIHDKTVVVTATTSLIAGRSIIQKIINDHNPLRIIYPNHLI